MDSLRPCNATKNEHRLERLKRRNKDVKKEFDKLHSKKKFGKRLYSMELIVTMVAHKFYISEKTTEDIVYQRTRY